MIGGTPTRGAPHRDRTAGFLLTETLATFTLSAFVLLGLVSASSVLLRAVDRSVAHVQDVDDLGRTIDAVARDVSGLARARWNGVEPQPFVFRGGPNSLVFAQTQGNADGTRTTRVVALREIVAGGGARLMRGEARLSARAAGFGDLHFAPQRELGTGSARLRFSYVAPAGSPSAGARLRQWSAPELLPAAIVIEAVARDSGRVLASMRVPIRANADIGCLEVNGQAKADPAAPAAVATGTSAAGGVAPQQAATAPANPGGALGVATRRGFCGRADKDRTADGQPQPPAPAATRAPL